MTIAGTTRTQAMHALRYARGRYSAERASQLSGVPKTTVYDWQRNEIYAPDFASGSPMAWSYRDLVFLRVLAWLRQQKMPRPLAADRVRHLKSYVAEGNTVLELRADSTVLAVDGDLTGRFGGPSILFADLLGTFNVLDAMEEFGRTRLWGPDLVTPSTHTYISPWVLGGDPCVDRTRIQTASIFTLRAERGLDTADIVELYPGLEPVAADDAYLLESRLRGIQAPAAA